MSADDSDIFDVLAYLSFNTPMKTRKECLKLRMISRFLIFIQITRL